MQIYHRAAGSRTPTNAPYEGWIVAIYFQEELAAQCRKLIILQMLSISGGYNTRYV